MQKIILLFILVISFTGVCFSQEDPTIAPDQETNLEMPLVLKVVITIDGMACQEGCANTISKNLTKTQGIENATVSYLDKKAIVSFDDGLISIEEICDIITQTKVKEYVYTINKTTFE